MCKDYITQLKFICYGLLLLLLLPSYKWFLGCYVSLFRRFPPRKGRLQYLCGRCVRSPSPSLCRRVPVKGGVKEAKSLFLIICVDCTKKTKFLCQSYGQGLPFSNFLKLRLHHRHFPSPQSLLVSSKKMHPIVKKINSPYMLILQYTTRICAQNLESRFTRLFFFPKFQIVFSGFERVVA
jgi:hypothetical protein